MLLNIKKGNETMKMPKKLSEGEQRAVWKFEGKSLAGTKVCGRDQICSLVLRCHRSRARAPDIKSSGAGWGKRDLLCFPSTGCIWMRIWHCSDVCAAAIGKHELTTALPLWLNHSTPFCFLGCLAGIMRPFGIEFLTDVSNSAHITLWSLEIAYIESWISGHLFL